MSEDILQRISEAVVLGDGGYLLELERRGYVQAGPFVPEPSITNPDALAGLHREFVDAGVDVLQTLTFYASEDKLATVGLEGRVEDMNREATRIARRVAGEAERDVLVAGNLSCAWVYRPEDPKTHRRTRALFDRQLDVMTREGVDFVIAETFNWLGEAMIAAEAIKATGLPAMITMGPDNDPNSFEGYSPGEQVKRLADAGVDIVGANCLRSPEYMLPIMEEMRAAVPDTVHMAAQPVAFHGTDERPNYVSLPEFPYEYGHSPIRLRAAPYERAVGPRKAASSSLRRPTLGPGREVGMQGTGKKAFEYIVVGCGGIGSAAVYWLSRAAGSEVLGLEQFHLGHDRGGSEDHSRIIRLSYHDQAYTTLTPHTYQAWSEIEDESDVRLVFETGGLDLESVEDAPDYINHYAGAMAAVGIPYEELSAQEVMDRFPQFTLDESVLGVYQL